MHFVVRSSMARGQRSLLAKENARFVRELLQKLCRRWGIRVYEFSNNGNHLHLLIQARTVQGFRNFSRVFTALVARKVTGSRKGRGLKGRFWDSIPFTRIVAWGKAFGYARNYVRQNRVEAKGLAPHHSRTTATPWILDKLYPLPPP